MTLTLQDAQHASWKIFRKINDKLDVEKAKSWSPSVTATDLLAEAGKVAAVVKDLEKSQPPEKPETKKMLAKELNDLLYNIFVLAEHYSINLEETFLEQASDYLLRFLA